MSFPPHRWWRSEEERLEVLLRASVEPKEPVSVWAAVDICREAVQCLSRRPLPVVAGLRDAERMADILEHDRTFWNAPDWELTHSVLTFAGQAYACSQGLELGDSMVRFFVFVMRMRWPYDEDVRWRNEAVRIAAHKFAPVERSW